MRVLRVVGRLLSGLLTTIAKALGATSGAKTFDHDNATSVYKSREDYRP